MILLTQVTSSEIAEIAIIYMSSARLRNEALNKNKQSKHVAPTREMRSLYNVRKVANYSKYLRISEWRILLEK